MKLFTLEHFAYLLLWGLCMGWILWFSRRPFHTQKDQIFRISLVIVLVGSKLVWNVYRFYFLDVSWQKLLPFQLCDLALIIVALSLYKPNHKTLKGVAYLLGVSSATLAILFPDISETGWIQPIASLRYFVTHIGIFCGGLYLLSRKMDLLLKKTFWITFWTYCGFTIVVWMINNLLGTNYMFLTRRPRSAMILEVIPESIYPFVALALGWIVFWILFWSTNLGFGFLKKRKSN